MRSRGLNEGKDAGPAPCPDWTCRMVKQRRIRDRMVAISRHARAATMIAIVVPGCAGVHRGSTPPVSEPVSDERVLTRAATAGVKVGSVYELLVRLRPSMLAWMPGAPLAVYVDDARALGIEELKTIRAEDVREVRLLSPSEASFKYGRGAGGMAALDVSTVAAERQPRR